MLCSVYKQYRNEAVNVLNWLAYAERPLSLDELAEVMVIDLETETVALNDRGNLADILDILAALVIVDTSDEGEEKSSERAALFLNGESDNRHEMDVDPSPGANLPHTRHSGLLISKHTRIRFAHYSVKEYLESERVAQSNVCQFHLSEARGNRLLTQSCLLYLKQYSSSPSKTSTKDDLVTFPMLRYAALNWVHHSVLQQQSDFSREIAFLSSNDVKEDWVRVFELQYDWALDCAFSSPDRVLPSHVKEECTQMLAAQQHWTLDGPVEHDLVDPWISGSALYYASAIGHEGIVKILLSSGSDVNAKSGPNGYALVVASWNGHYKIVKMLIDSGADANARNAAGSYNALQYASMIGYEHIVKILLDHGADIDAGGGYENENPLYLAVAEDDDRVVRMLIDGGANVNARGGRHGNALTAVCAWTGEELLELLLRAGADVNAQGGIWGNALQLACNRGRRTMIEPLLRHGADVNAQGGSLGTALQTALAGWSENVKVVKLLLRAGADVNAPGKECALQTASRKGFIRVVKLLIDFGADVDARGTETSDSALRLAMQQGYEEVVRMLKAKGADVPTQEQLEEERKNRIVYEPL